MTLVFTSSVQDTTVVEVAHDGLALVSAWTMVAMGLAFLAILVVLVLVLAELRTLSRTWTGFLTTTTDRSKPLVEHASSAARNLDHITTVVRSEIDRLNGMIEGVTDEIGEASLEVKRRVADLSALLDLAQSEAEDAVLDAAAKLRMLRAGAALLGRGVARRAGGGGGGGGGGTDDHAAAAPASETAERDGDGAEGAAKESAPATSGNQDQK